MSVAEWSGTSLRWFEELAALKDRIGGLFRRAEPRRQVGLLLDGLIGGTERKNGWQLAEYAGDPAPWRMQALLGRTIWDQEKARDICRDYVVEHLGDPSGVLVLDATGFLKKGSHSVGVARQYSGTAGRIENCQIGVFLGYAGPEGTSPDRSSALLAEGLDRGRRASEGCEHPRGRGVRYQAEDRHRHGGGGARCRRSVCVGAGRFSLRQRQELARHARTSRQALCSLHSRQRKN
jgi:SRSO17 transposase